MSIEHPATIGIAASDLSKWLQRQVTDLHVLELRKKLIEKHRDQVIAFLSQAEAGLRELVQYLGTRDKIIFPPESNEALATLGRTYAEDICILTPEADNHILSAAILCFPNRWRLADKAGKSIIGVHDPVPEYAEKLSAQVEFFLHRLRPGRCFVRSNWGLAANGELHLPEPVAAVNPALDTDFYMRREDQSFVKLPMCGAVIFTIRTTVIPWPDVSAADRAAVIAQAKSLSPEWLRYKSMHV